MMTHCKTGDSHLDLWKDHRTGCCLHTQKHLWTSEDPSLPGSLGMWRWYWDQHFAWNTFQKRSTTLLITLDWNVSSQKYSRMSSKGNVLAVWKKTTFTVVFPAEMLHWSNVCGNPSITFCVAMLTDKLTENWTGHVTCLLEGEINHINKILQSWMSQTVYCCSQNRSYTEHWHLYCPSHNPSSSL